MAPALATRCTACGTVFRVVPDQLRVSEGWVRCGRCSEVFNAAENLVDIDTGAQRAAVDAPAPDVPEPLVPEAPQQADFELELPPPASEAPESAADETAAPAAEDVPAAEAGGDPPSFVRQAERAARWRQPKVRAALGAAAAFGVIGLVAQVSYEYRDLMAARFAATRPALEGVCRALGCTVEAAHAIDSLAVESSGLVRVEASSIYRLSLGLRNRAGIEVALPALDLSLTDSQGRLVARKVLRMADFGSLQATLGAGRDLVLQTTLQTAGPAGEPPPPPIVGYTIEVFYP
jgi:predicted Zn finger-like uncharacterized protein